MKKSKILKTTDNFKYHDNEERELIESIEEVFAKGLVKLEPISGEQKWILQEAARNTRKRSQ
ncbi:MAG: hypothetical protein ACI9VM_000521 [Candidatus Azotimanducaceae bacterium]|jgi:hypothetical protein